MSSSKSLVLRERLILDPEDEYLRARCHSSGAQDYATLRHEGRKITLHRFLAKAPTGCLVDHKDGNILNNRKDNLRLVSSSQNRHNVAGPTSRSSTRYLGVYKKAGRFYARLEVRGKQYYSYGHSSSEEAHQARLSLEKTFGISPRRMQLHD